MHISRQNQAVLWGCIIIATLANIAGYVWNLYQQIWLFDEILHAFTIFALTLLAAVLLYDKVLKGAQTHPILFIFVAASLGVGMGALWEIAEWAYDQIVPGNVILGKNDTMIDLIADLAGAVSAGILTRGMLQKK